MRNENISINNSKLQKIPFTMYDVGWVVLCIGMAIGAGIVFMPVQIGLKGIWVFIVAIALSYPAIYFLQDLYLKTLSRTEECEDYTNIISQYLGKNWGVALGAVYFLSLIMIFLSYSLAVIFDSASYIKTFGITEELLSDSPWYSLLVFSILVSIAAQGERLLFKVSGPMIIVKFSIILALGLLMIPYWNFDNITAFPEFLPFLRDVLLTLPFTLYSILFVQILNPMNIAYRKMETDKEIAAYRAVRVNRITYIILAIVVLFFAFSFTFSISHEQAVQAFEQNISALAIAAQVMSGNAIKIMSSVLNVFSIITAFLGIYLGVQESVKGIVTNLLSRVIPENKINKTILHYAVTICIILALWIWVSTKFSVLYLLQLAGPTYGIIACLIPVYLIYKVSNLSDLKGFRAWYVAFFGILLCVSPLFSLFE